MSSVHLGSHWPWQGYGCQGKAFRIRETGSSRLQTRWQCWTSQEESALSACGGIGMTGRQTLAPLCTTPTVPTTDHPCPTTAPGQSTPTLMRLTQLVRISDRMRGSPPLNAHGGQLPEDETSGYSWPAGSAEVPREGKPRELSPEGHIVLVWQFGKLPWDCPALRLMDGKTPGKSENSRYFCFTEQGLQELRMQLRRLFSPTIIIIGLVVMSTQ